MVEAGTIAKLDKSFLTNIGNLGEEWSNPGYDPDNTYTIPYMWWTTGVGYDPARIKEEPTSSKALWDARWKQHISMLDDWQEVFGLTLIQQGKSANTENAAELDAALALLEQQKPLVRTYSTDTITTMTSATSGSGTSGAPTGSRSRSRSRTSPTTSSRRVASRAPIPSPPSRGP